MSSRPSDNSKPRRACDACHKRKLRCDSDGNGDDSVCTRCMISNLKCTYDSIPRKRGPKGRKATVLASIRQAQNSDEGSELVEPRQRNSVPTEVEQIDHILSPEVLDLCFECYFARLHPLQPILSRRQVFLANARKNTSVEAYCMVAALCAFIFIRTNIDLPASVWSASASDPPSTVRLGGRIIRELIIARRSHDYYQDCTLSTVYTSFFIHHCFNDLGFESKAWIYLREATTLAYVLKLNDEASYDRKDPGDWWCKQQIFWTLFIAEREFSLRCDYPVTLSPTISMPSIDRDPFGDGEALILAFSSYISLYKLVDNRFLAMYRNRDVLSPACLDDLKEYMLEPRNLDLSKFPETVAVQLKVGESWMQILWWQIALRGVSLSVSSPRLPLQIHFPALLVSELLQFCSGRSKDMVEDHGICLVNKMIDIARSLVDMISLPVSPIELGIMPDCWGTLHTFIDLIGSVRCGNGKATQLLRQLNQTSLQSGLPESRGMLEGDDGDDSQEVETFDEASFDLL